MILMEEDRRTRREIFPSTTLFIINSTWTDPGLRDERPGTKLPEPWHGLSWLFYIRHLYKYVRSFYPIVHVVPSVLYFIVESQ
jgi:hypothetical protein